MPRIARDPCRGIGPRCPDWRHPLSALWARDDPICVNPPVPRTDVSFRRRTPSNHMALTAVFDRPTIHKERSLAHND